MSVLKPEIISKQYGKGVNEPLNSECEKSKKVLVNALKIGGDRNKKELRVLLIRLFGIIVPDVDIVNKFVQSMLLR